MSKAEKLICNTPALYHAHTIHHKTPVMCLVEEITTQK
ncbi:DUF4431 domain-containing protein [Xenorhabdus bovienii]